MDEPHLQFSEYLLTAAAELGLGESAFRRADSGEWQCVLAAVRDTFPGSLFLWLITNGPELCVETGFMFPEDRGYLWLTRIIPEPSQPIWFIAEEWGGHGAVVFRTSAEAVQQILGECHHFEYCLIPERFEWLVGEHHSGVTFALGEPVTSRLIQLANAVRKQN